MSTPSSILDEINNLSLSEKILIVEEIWNSIANHDEYPQLTSEQQTQLLQRSKEAKQNIKQGRTWSEIKQEFWHS